MAKGKHKRSAANQRLAAARERIADLEQQIADETAMSDAAAAELAAARSAEADLRSETVGLERDTEDTEAWFRTENAYLGEMLGAARLHHRSVQEAWQSYAERCIDTSPGGQVERVEAFSRACGLVGTVTLSPSRQLDTEAVVRLQQARGERVMPRDVRQRYPDWVLAAWLGWLRPSVRVRARTAGVLPEAPLASEALAVGLQDASRYGADQSPEAALAAAAAERDWQDVTASGVGRAQSLAATYAWCPSPLASFTSTVQSSSLRALGSDAAPTTSGTAFGAGPFSLAQATEGASALAGTSAQEWPRALPSLTATSREDLVHRASPSDLMAAWGERMQVAAAVAALAGVHGTHLGAGPRYARPGRAAVLRGMYARSALAQWTFAAECLPEDVPDAHGWGGPRWRADFARAAVGLECAAPFWLPAGQTFSFADSEPLDAEAVGEIALPFPQVLLAFAEPLVLSARRRPSQEESAALDVWGKALSSVSDPTGRVRSLLDAGQEAADLARLGLGALLDCVGAQVEGVLLYADSLGRPRDDFAWCVAVPSRGRSMAGRWVVPAQMSRTRYRSVVENLMAVAAWADWHQPDATAVVPSGVRLSDALTQVGTADFQRDFDRHGSGVHVLNVSRTERTGSRSGGEPGRRLAPHVRRGHWRRQHYGTGGALVRRVRIAPVVVNAHRGDAGERVYRLPSADA